MVAILCIDSDEYCAALDAQLRLSGGCVVQTQFADAMEHLRSGRFDMVIADVEDEGYRGSPDPYTVLAEVLRSEWGQTHQILAFSHVDRRVFEHRCQKAGIDLARVPLYSKREFELPPCCECIRDTLLAHPNLIRFDHTKWTPSAITENWIRNAAAIYPYLEDFLRKRANFNYDDIENAVLPNLPVGFSYVYMLQNCTWLIADGGIAAR
jgi:hypothetical protein